MVHDQLRDRVPAHVEVRSGTCNPVTGSSGTTRGLARDVLPVLTGWVHVLARGSAERVRLYGYRKRRYRVVLSFKKELCLLRE